MTNNEIWDVSILNKYIKGKFVNDEQLRNIQLKGELSNFKRYSSGHMYFSIKDENSKINAVMFKFRNNGLNFEPADGMEVIVKGKVDVYEVNGQYQFYVDEMFQAGLGNLFIKYEELKKKLKNEGLFDKEKKAIPKFPKKIGVVTSPTGAVIRDIITTVQRRWPFVEIILWPTLVQGETAKYNIEKNIRLANDFGVDVLIIGRGGGSIEDLWAFNEEVVARAIFDSEVPVISAVGHETDFTIADFVADSRAPTPTAAAELTVPNIHEVNNQLVNNKVRLNKFIQSRIEYFENYLNMIKDSYALKNPMVLCEAKMEKLGLLLEKINNIVDDKIKVSGANLKLLNEKLIILNPLETINRGYSVVKMDNQVISTVDLVEVGAKITVELKDGYIENQVEKVSKK